MQLRDCLCRSSLPVFKWLVATCTLVMLVGWLATAWWSVSVLEGDKAMRLASGLMLYIDFGDSGVVSSQVMIGPSVSPLQFGGRWYRSGTMLIVGVPLWPVVLVGAAVTAITFKADAARRRRRALGMRLCIGCSYDRVGLADAAPCPECGLHRPAM